MRSTMWYVLTPLLLLDIEADLASKASENGTEPPFLLERGRIHHRIET